MLNSSNYVKEEGILNAGNEVAPELSAEDLANPNLVMYYHHVPNARFVLPDGAELIFRGGCYPTSNKDIRKELDKVANKPGTFIYTKTELKAYVESEVQAVVGDSQVPAAEANKLSTGTEVQGVVTSTGARK